MENQITPNTDNTAQESVCTKNRKAIHCDIWLKLNNKLGCMVCEFADKSKIEKILARRT